MTHDPRAPMPPQDDEFAYLQCGNCDHQMKWKKADILRLAQVSTASPSVATECQPTQKPICIDCETEILPDDRIIGSPKGLRHAFICGHRKRDDLPAATSDDATAPVCDTGEPSQVTAEAAQSREAEDDVTVYRRWANLGGVPLGQKCTANPKDVHDIHGCGYGQGDGQYFCEFHEMKKWEARARVAEQALRSRIENTVSVNYVIGSPAYKQAVERGMKDALATAKANQPTGVKEKARDHE